MANTAPDITHAHDPALPGATRAVQRLFFAIWPPAALRPPLTALVRDTLAGQRARLVPVENLHITLAFLGTVEAARRDCYEQAADRVSAAAFTIDLDRLGYWSRKRLLWVGAECDALQALVTDLQVALLACGYPPVSRPFHIHLTLARHVPRNPLRGNTGRTPSLSSGEKAQPIEPLPWPVLEFTLVASETRPDGPRYTLLRRWALGPTA